MDYEKIGFWSIITFAVVTSLNILVNIVRRGGGNLGLFFYVSVIAATVGIWSLYSQLNQKTQQLAEVKDELSRRPEFPTVAIEKTTTTIGKEEEAESSE